MGFHADSGTISTPLVEKRHMQDGKVFRAAVAHTTLTVGTLYELRPDADSGMVTAALAANSKVYRVGLALKADKEDEVSWLQTGGLTTALGMTTASLELAKGRGLRISVGAVADDGTAPFTAAAFAVNVAPATTATARTALMFDKYITAISAA